MKKTLTTVHVNLLFIATLILSNVAFAQYTELAKSIPELNDGAAGDNSGWSVSIDGNYAVIGSPLNNDIFLEAGCAFIYFYDGSNWLQQAKLTASDAGSGDEFGYSVSISGDHVVVGARNDDDGASNAGAAYIFSKPIGVWVNATETAKLTASDAAVVDRFGNSVSISGDHVVITAADDDDGGSASGSAYVFSKPVGNWVTTTETAKLTASDAASDDQFGYSVSISGDYVVVGARHDADGGLASGSAYVFSKPVGNWVTTTETAKLTASDAAAGDRFGSSISISGDHVVVGANYSDDAGNASGSAYVFSKPVGNWVTTTETAKLTASDPGSNDQFGNSVSISGDHVVVGARYDDDEASNSGAAYIFSKPVGNWVTATETTKLKASDAESVDQFGYSVSISGDYLVIGAPFDDDGGVDSGSAYLFGPVCPNTTNTFSVTECTSYTVPSSDETYNTPGTITVNDTITNGCGSDSIMTITVSIIGPLSGTYNETVCFGGSIDVNGTTFDASNLTGDVVYTGAGPNNNCDSTVTVTLTIEPEIDVTLTHVSTTLTANEIGADYQWLDCDNGNMAIAGATDQSYTATSNGDYAVEITLNNCVDTSDCETVSSVGISEHENLEYSIYPNPTTGMVNISGTSPIDLIEVLDTDGRLLMSKKSITSLDVSNLVKGIYILRVNQTQTTSLVRH